jgi:hypothetical protein
VQLESLVENLLSEISLLKGSPSPAAASKYFPRGSTRSTTSSNAFPSEVQSVGPWVAQPLPNVTGSKSVRGTSGTPKVHTGRSTVISDDFSDTGDPPIYDPAMFQPSPVSNNGDSTEDVIQKSYKAIVEMLSKLMRPDLVTPIAGFLQNLISSKNVPICNLQATVVTSLTDDGRPWLMVDWKEGENKVLALFEVDLPTGIYNCLMHIGIGTEQPDGQPWSQSYLSWYVQNIDGLRRLLVVSQHVFDMQHWPKDENLLRLFCDFTECDASEEQYVPIISKG